MITKKIGCLGLAVAAVGGLLAGCSSSDNTSGSTTVTFSGQTSEQKIWDPLIKAFEQANPGITVKATYTPNDSYPQLVQTQLQAGHAADVIQTTPGSGGGLSALRLAAGGQVADLSSSSWVSSLAVGSKALVTLNDKVYAYPTDLAPLFLAYNPAIFSSKGVSVPTTFADLLKACTTFANAGIIPITMAGASYQNVSIMIGMLAANNVWGPDPSWNQKRSNKQTTFASSPSWQKVMSDLGKMKDAKCFSADVAGVKSPVHIQRFATGQAAMEGMPAQAINQVRSLAPADFKFSSFAFPADSADQTKVSGASGIAVVVNAKASNVSAAQKFVDFLSTPANRVSYATTAGSIAPGAQPDGSDFYTPELTPLKPYLESSDKSITMYYLSWPSAAIMQQIATSVQGIFTGQKSAQDVLADADKAWDGA